MDNLQQAAQKIGQDVAGAGGNPAGGAPEAQSDRGTTEPKKDDDVIDAEYEVKN
jgi:hypothetical protein